MVIGERVQVMGNSGSGKSTLGERLAGALDAPFVELDALNWLPGWVGLNQTDPEEFERRIRAATRGERWVAAGSYERFSRRVLWPRLDTVVWLDLPLRILVCRLLRRSWRRWRSGEMVWGTNQEKFWPQLRVWRKHDSLLGWLITQHARKRRNMTACMSDPRWAHIRFMRLTSPGAVEAFAASVERMHRPSDHGNLEATP